MDMEKAECSDHKENVTTGNGSIPADEALAQFTDAEKLKAFRKLDWNLIPLYGFTDIVIFA